MAECALEGCNKKARRRFCCNRHKDRYHNLHNPRGKFAHLHPDNLANKPTSQTVSSVDLDAEHQANLDYEYATTHPFSGEGLGQD